MGIKHGHNALDPHGGPKISTQVQIRNSAKRSPNRENRTHDTRRIHQAHFFFFKTKRQMIKIKTLYPLKTKRQMIKIEIISGKKCKKGDKKIEHTEAATESVTESTKSTIPHLTTLTLE